MAWIPVDASEIRDRARTETIDGVEIVLQVSPYDIPTDISGDYQPERKRFVIKFSYLNGDERLKPQKSRDGMRIYIGTVTNRIHMIEIDVDAMKAEAIKVSVQPMVINAVNHLKQTTTTTAPPWMQRGQDNYDVTSELLGKQADPIFRAFEKESQHS